MAGAIGSPRTATKIHTHFHRSLQKALLGSAHTQVSRPSSGGKKEGAGGVASKLPIAFACIGISQPAGGCLGSWRSAADGGKLPPVTRIE